MQSGALGQFDQFVAHVQGSISANEDVVGRRLRLQARAEAQLSRHLHYPFECPAVCFHATGTAADLRWFAEMIRMHDNERLVEKAKTALECLGDGPQRRSLLLGLELRQKFKGMDSQHITRDKRIQRAKSAVSASALSHQS